MKLQISQQIFDAFPGATVGVVSATGVDNRGSDTRIDTMLTQEVRRIRGQYSLEDLKLMPQLQSWRAAYVEFKASPTKYRCSVESLYAAVLTGGALRSINKVVDLYNLISLRHLVPVGGCDTSRVHGDVMLCRATGHEPFVALNQTEVTYPKPPEVVYRDQERVLCRRWNWREADSAKLSPETHSILLVVEGLPPVGGREVEAATVELSEQIRNFTGGVVSTSLLCASRPEAAVTAMHGR